MNGRCPRGRRWALAATATALVMHVAPGARGQDMVRGPFAAATPAPAASVDSGNEQERVIVTGRAEDLLGVATSSSEGVVSSADLATRPIFRPAEIMETIPGVIVTQHSGSGKANQ